MFADYNYYVNEYYGTKIQDLKEFNYLSNKAVKYVEKYSNIEDKNTKDCICAISECLQKYEKQGNMTSESIPNAYSVSYGSSDNDTMMNEIKSILALYLGDKYSSVGIAKVIY